jgi:iron complex transport system ATP-binding protein
LLVLDEPCEGLDIASKERFLHDLARIAASGEAPAIVMVTHHVDEILPFFTNVLVLKEGHVFANGTVKDIVTSSTLSRLFGMELHVEKKNRRFSCKLL